jgi:YVTN family beta-propeller protein
MRRIQTLFIPLFLLGAMSVLSSESVPAKASATGMLLTANQGDHTLSIIDPQAGHEVAAVPEGGITGHEVAASEDGKLAYVPIYGNSGVGKPGTDGRNMVVVDIASQKVVGDLDFGHAVRPHCAVLDHASGLLYVTTELDHTVSIIDPKTLKVVGSVPTGQAESHMLAISKDGQRGYTANVGVGTVSVLDLKAKKTVAVIPISTNTQRIALSIDDSMVFTSDQAKPQLAVIDTASNKVKTWIPLPGTGYGTGATLDGKWLLVTVPHEGKVAVLNLQTMTIDHTITVPAAPQEVLLRPDGKVAYVSCNVSKKVAAIDLTDWSVNLIDAGKGADGLGWAAR